MYLEWRRVDEKKVNYLSCYKFKPGRKNMAVAPVACMGYREGQIQGILDDHVVK